MPAPAHPTRPPAPCLLIALLAVSSATILPSAPALASDPSPSTTAAAAPAHSTRLTAPPRAQLRTPGRAYTARFPAYQPLAARIALRAVPGEPYLLFGPSAPAPGSAAPNYWVPVLEIMGQHWTFNTFSRVYGSDFAQISPRTMWTNLTGDWEYDEDALVTNQLGHPYQGALYFTAARSTHLGFWTSSIYTFFGSLGWEYLMETEKPSINDQITTTFSGVLFGEVFHRLALALLWEGRGEPGLVRRFAAAAVNPMGEFNREAMGYTVVASRPPQLYANARFGYAAFAKNTLEDPTMSDAVHRQVYRNLHAGFSIQYGHPGDPELRFDEPLDYFEVSGEVDVFDDRLYTSLFIRGLVLGREHQLLGSRGVWGLYAGHDYLSAGAFTLGAFSASLGTTAQWRLGSRGFLQITALAGLVPMGAAGRRLTDTFRDYHLGTGTSTLLDIAVGRKGTGVIRLTSRSALIDALPDLSRTELVSLNTISGQLAIWRNHAIGAELVLLESRRDITGDHDMPRSPVGKGAQALLVYSFALDDSFGGAF